MIYSRFIPRNISSEVNSTRKWKSEGSVSRGEKPSRALIHYSKMGDLSETDLSETRVSIARARARAIERI